MRATDWGKGWTVRHLGEEGEGRRVDLPDDAMLREERSAKAAGGLNIGWFEGYDYSYTKSFTITEEENRLHHVFEFEGVYRKAEVYLNGQKAAFHPYGYSGFYVEADPHIRPGENLLEVVCHNADQPNSRWYTGSGIYRPVKLWRSGESFIELDGVKIRTVSLSPAVIEVRVKTNVPGRVRVEIVDGEKELASKWGKSREAFSFTLPEAELWSPENPKLYGCRVFFEDDAAEETFGIRQLSWGQEGFAINGERVILRGACIHHDNGLLGAVCDPDALERKVRILMENGYNAIRSAHNPCSKTALEICDRLGMLVMDEYIDHWYIHKTLYDYVEFFDGRWRADLEDMVDKDYNHPCVIMYSTGNEVAETAKKRGIQLAGEMTNLLHELDDTRPVTCGINIFFNFLNSIGFGQYSDKKAAKEAARNAKAKEEGRAVKEKATGSKFFNDLAGLLGAGFMKRGATLHGSDVTTRKAYAAMDIAGYNYGEMRYKKDLVRYPKRLILGSETFCADAYKFWELAKQEPRILGDFVWSGFDYLGETMIGAWEYQDYAKTFDSGLGWISAGAGRIDLTGKPLGEALYTRVAFEREAGPYLAVRPFFEEGKHSPSAWKMTNAMPSWSFRGCEGTKATVEVYARAAKVELFLNGQKVGEGTPEKDCRCLFQVPYENGILEAVSLDEQGQEIGRDRLTTAAEEDFLRAEPEEERVRPGHLSFIRLRFTDKNGVTKVMKRGIIEVSVEGGTLAGLGSACPFYELSYLDSKCDTYYGEAMAIVRSGEEGKVLLTAQCGDLLAKAEVLIGE